MKKQGPPPWGIIKVGRRLGMWRGFFDRDNSEPKDGAFVSSGKLAKN